MRVKKFRTISIYDIGRMESYLSDMAKEGLFLIGMSLSYNHFRVNEPAEMEYRIEFGEKVLNKEMREMYEMSGWSYTCSIMGIHVFQAAASDTLVEIHTDPEEQSYTLRRSCKNFKRLIALEIGLFLIMIADTVFITRIGGTPILNLLENNFIFLIDIALMIYIIFEVVRQMKTLIRIRKRLQMGFHMNHHEPWRRRSVSKFFIYGFIAIFFILSIASITYNIRNIAGMITGQSNYELTLNTELPVVRLNNIEKLSSPVMRTYISKENSHPLSKVFAKHNVFMKEYEINEEFIQEDMTWEGEVYSPSIRTKYYKVGIPFMVEGALSDVLHQAENYFIGFPEDKIPVEKLDCDGLEEIYYIPSGMKQEHYFGLVVRKGNVILWMTYCGQKTRAEVMVASQALFKSLDS